jgi:hypothetical protein
LPFLEVVLGVLGFLDGCVFTDGVLDIGVELSVDLAKRGFHNVNGVGNGLNLVFVRVHKLENLFLLDPLDVDETLVQDLIQFVNFVLNKRSLHWMEAGDDSIVLTDDDLKLGDLSLKLLVRLINR